MIVSTNVDRRPPLYRLGGLPSCSRQDRELRASEVRLAAEMRALVAATRRKRRHLLYGMVGTAAVIVALSIAIFSGGSTIASAGGGKHIGASFSSRLVASLPQRGTLLGRTGVPVRIQM
jgi:hypothetical protein